MATVGFKGLSMFIVLALTTTVLHNIICVQVTGMSVYPPVSVTFLTDVLYMYSVDDNVFFPDVQYVQVRVILLSQCRLCD